MSDLGIFRLEFESNIFIFEIGILKFVYLQNFTKKQKCLNFGTKMPDLCIFGLKFESNIVIFEISILEFVKLQHFAKKRKMPRFWIKNALLGYFWSRILENYCHIWNQHLRICLIAKFCEETKMPKFKTKNTIFGYFWARMPFFGIFGQELKKNYCQIWNQHHWICLIVKFCEIMKMLQFGTKSALFAYFLAKIFKKLLSYLKSAPSN